MSASGPVHGRKEPINTLGYPYDNVRRVRESLESARYKWRTIKGISRETNIDPETVHAIINTQNDLIQRSRPSKDGQELFTTRVHYNKLASPAEKIKSALINRID